MSQYSDFAFVYDELMNEVDYNGWVKYIEDIIDSEGVKVKNILDKTTPRLIQFHTLKNAVNPPFLGGFSIFNTVVA